MKELLRTFLTFEVVVSLFAVAVAIWLIGVGMRLGITELLFIEPTTQPRPFTTSDALQVVPPMGQEPDF